MNINNEIKNSIIFILIFLLTNIIVHGLRETLKMKKFIIEEIYNYKFFKKMLIATFCILLIRFVFIYLKTNYLVKQFLDKNDLLEGSLKYIMISFTKRLINSLLNNNNMFTNEWLRNLFIVITSSFFINIVINPFIPKIKFYKNIIKIIQSLFITFMLDYFIDLKLDNPEELGLTFIDVFLGYIFETPIKTIIDSKYINPETY